MSRKLIAVIVVMMLVIIAAGCKKAPKQQSAEGTQGAQSTGQKTEVNTPADYNAQAKKEINSENMQAELDKIEKELEQEKSGQL